GLGLAHLDDIDVHLAVGERLHLGADLVDVRALLADHDARTGSVDRHARLAVRTLDDNLADRGLLEVFEQGLADLDVFLQQLAVLALAGEPAAVPGAVDPEAQTDRVDLLTHYAVSSTWRTTMVRFENVCSRRAEWPRPRARKRFITRPSPT